jgi:uncharacterized UBP type Zn finger protein
MLASVQTIHCGISRHHEKFSDQDQNDVLEVLFTLLDAVDEDFHASPRAHGRLHPPGLSRIELREFCHNSISDQQSKDSAKALAVP